MFSPTACDELEFNRSLASMTFKCHYMYF